MRPTSAAGVRDAGATTRIYLGGIYSRSPPRVRIAGLSYGSNGRHWPPFLGGGYPDAPGDDGRRTPRRCTKRIAWDTNAPNAMEIERLLSNVEGYQGRNGRRVEITSRVMEIERSPWAQCNMKTHKTDYTAEITMNRSNQLAQKRSKTKGLEDATREDAGGAVASPIAADVLLDALSVNEGTLLRWTTRIAKSFGYL